MIDKPQPSSHILKPLCGKLAAPLFALCKVFTMDKGFPIHPQPDDLTCGPTCLYSIYQYFGESRDLASLINEVEMLEEGGTLASHLGNHALTRGYAATIYTMNINLFDPSWFHQGNGTDLSAKLKLQVEQKPYHEKLPIATKSYLRFLFLGGRVEFVNLDRNLLVRLLENGQPIIAGLSATYLYRCAREDPQSCVADDVGGEPTGHFVVLSGYQPETKLVEVSDPYKSNPFSQTQQYTVAIDHLIGSILLGALTYDANLLVITRKS